MSGVFELRGVIEGFYGPPWSDRARRRAITFLARRGMNAYVYAPKSDPFHRERWRTPYPSDELDRLLGLVSHCKELGVEFGFAVSPGLDIDPGSSSDRAALWAKYEPFVNAGAAWMVLAVDDVPVRPGAGAGHAALARDLHNRAPDATLTLVPTDYVGSRSTPYLEELCAALDDDVALMWTGRTVVAPTIGVHEARARREATGGHPLVIWDNYPVNDAFMETALHLGPVRGRDAELAAVCQGLLANPMCQAEASLLPLATVADFLRDPDAYDPEASWEAAIVELGGENADALRAFAHACASSALASVGDQPLHRLVDAFERHDPEAGSRLRAELEAGRDARSSLPESWQREVGPWAEQVAREAAAGLAALDLDESADSSEPWSVLGVVGAWWAARNGQSKIAYGPRFACYPTVVQDEAGGTTADASGAFVEDQSAIDRLCRLTLAREATT